VTFQRGEPVRISFQGKTVSGEVLLASASGLSLTLILDEYLGAYINLMPVLWIDDGYVDLLRAEPVTIFRLHQG
jgi:hypothetical protein